MRGRVSLNIGKPRLTPDPMLTSAFREGADSWSSYWTSRSLFFLDGTIKTVGSDKYFTDKSTNGRDFLITGYDFDSAWTTGFPYKSAATISAPAGDAALIAADINNFLYDAGGTPNAIPVVSLFQDIDYEHKIFCKHAAQVLDGNGVETYEPRVSHIFMAQSVLSGDDLTKAQTDFEVPDKLITGIREVGSGKSYATIGAALTASSANETIYIYSGQYNEFINPPAGIRALIALGHVVLTNASYGVLMNTIDSQPTFKGIDLTANISAPQVVFNKNTSISLFEKLRLKDGTGGVGYFAGTLDDITIKDCVINKSNSVPADIVYSNCYFNVEATGSVWGLSGHKASVINCKISEVTSTGMTIITSIGSELHLKGCSFFGNILVDQVNNYAPKILIEYCSIILKTKNIINYKANTGTRDLSVNNNFLQSEGVSDLNIINSVGEGNAECNNNSLKDIARNFTIIMAGLTAASENEVSGNSIDVKSIIITCKNTNFQINNNNLISVEQTAIVVSNNIDLLATNGTISGNNLISKSGNGAALQIGTEGDADSYQLNNDTIISGNKSLCNRYWGNSAGSKHWALIAGQVIIAKHNYINGSFLGWVMKSNGLELHSVISYQILVNINNALLSKGNPGVWYYNNTIVVNDESFDHVGLVLMPDSLGTESINTKFKNNIIFDSRTIKDNPIIQASTADLVGSEIDYNVYYKASVKTHFALIDSAWVTFAEWQALGYDTHSIMLTDEQANALFTDVVNGDYSLKVGSVAIGAGEILDAAYDDGLDTSTVWGGDTALPTVVTKQQGAAWDCGAYVY